MHTRTYTILAVAAVFVIVGGWLLMRYDNPTGAAMTSLTPVSQADLITSDSSVQGPENAPLTIVEFADFQCPACGSQYPILKQFLEKHGSQVRLVFRNFPLPQHEHAHSAAVAAEAAKQQGKFWEMYDQLFQHQDKLTDEDIRGYAGAIGLDMNRFETDWHDSKLSDAVSRDFAAGQKLNVDATPTLFLNGIEARGAQSEAVLEAALTKALGN